MTDQPIEQQVFLPWLVREALGQQIEHVARFRAREDAEAFVARVGPEIPGTVDGDGGISGARRGREFRVVATCRCGREMEHMNARIFQRFAGGREDVYCSWVCPALPVPRPEVVEENARRTAALRAVAGPIADPIAGVGGFGAHLAAGQIE